MSKRPKKTDPAPNGAPPVRGSPKNRVEGLGKAGDAAAILVAIATPQRWEDNPKLIPESEIAEVMQSMVEFGFGRALVCWKPEVPMLLVGHKSLTAAERLGLDVVPVRWMPHLTEARAKAYAVADNQLGMKSRFDPEKLRAAVRGSAAEGLPIATLGFSSVKMERLLSDLAAPRVKEIPVGPARPQFWLSVRGPLPAQPTILEELKRTLGTLPGVTVTVGVLGR